MNITVSSSCMDLFDRWDEKNNMYRRAPEELAEAIVAILHMERGRGSNQELLEESADGIIALVHICYSNGLLDDLQAMIDRKLMKAVQQS